MQLVTSRSSTTSRASWAHSTPRTKVLLPVTCSPVQASFPAQRCYVLLPATGQRWLPHAASNPACQLLLWSSAGCWGQAKQSQANSVPACSCRTHRWTWLQGRARGRAEALCMRGNDRQHPGLVAPPDQAASSWLDTSNVGLRHTQSPAGECAAPSAAAHAQAELAPAEGHGPSCTQAPRSRGGRKKKLCEYADCQKVPCFNEPGQTQGRFCGAHR